MATSSTTLTMAKQLVPEEVWAAIQPLLPPKPPHLKGGRPWIEDRAVLGGIIYVLRAGVPWRLLPARELGCGSGVTCWRRLRDWQQAGVWQAVHHRRIRSTAARQATKHLSSRGTASADLASRRRGRGRLTRRRPVGRATDLSTTPSAAGPARFW